MRAWNPFGKVNMEIGSFLKASVYNKDYNQESAKSKEKNPNEINLDWQQDMHQSQEQEQPKK